MSYGADRGRKEHSNPAGWDGQNTRAPAPVALTRRSDSLDQLSRKVPLKAVPPAQGSDSYFQRSARRASGKRLSRYPSDPAAMKIDMEAAAGSLALLKRRMQQGSVEKMFERHAREASSRRQTEPTLHDDVDNQRRTNFRGAAESMFTERGTDERGTAQRANRARERDSSRRPRAKWEQPAKPMYRSRSEEQSDFSSGDESGRPRGSRPQQNAAPSETPTERPLPVGNGRKRQVRASSDRKEAPLRSRLARGGDAYAPALAEDEATVKQYAERKPLPEHARREIIRAASPEKKFFDEDEPIGQRKVESSPQFTEEAPEDNVQLEKCPTCSRTFNPKAYAVHQKVCKKVFATKRKAVDLSANRKPTDAAGNSIAASSNAPVKTKRRGPSKKKEPAHSDTPVGGAQNGKWKNKSSALRQAMQDARRVQQAIQRGEDISKLPPPTSTVEEFDERKLCPHCGRKFGEEQAKRHIPKCKDIRNKPTVLKKAAPKYVAPKPRVRRKQPAK